MVHMVETEICGTLIQPSTIEALLLDGKKLSSWRLTKDEYAHNANYYLL